MSDLQYLRDDVSIHAPAWGATTKARSAHPTNTRFNPRAHAGCDANATLLTNANVVSIHAPTRGATILKVHPAILLLVSIHAPTRGATIFQLDLAFGNIVSIHAPTRGATGYAFTTDSFMEFQSTRPHGARRPSGAFNSRLRM